MPTIKKILVPTDFSKNAAQIYELAQRTARKHNAQIDLIHIIPDSVDLSMYEEVMGNGSELKQEKEKLKAGLLEKLKSELQENFVEEHQGSVFVKSHAKIVRGINRHAGDSDYDMIIIASRGMGESIFSRGSVTERLIRVSNIPVLSSNESSHPPIQTVLMTTDGSDVSFEALPLAVSFAKRNGAKVQLLSIAQFDNITVKSIGRDSRIYEYAMSQLKNDVLQGLKKHVENSSLMDFAGEPSTDKAMVKSHSGEEVPLELIFKDAVSIHETIIKHAEENADLVVISTHGRSGLSKLFLGSVAEKVINHLELPVLTIRPEFARN